MAIFSNQATLTFNGVQTTSNVAYGEILDVLTVTKTALDTIYSPNGVITYVITVRNTGTNNVTGVTLTDDLGGYTPVQTIEYPLTVEPDSFRVIINGTLQPSPTVSVGPPLTLTNLAIPAGGDAVILYKATANEFADPSSGATLTNTATLTGGGLSTPIFDSATLSAATTPVLSINKSLSPAQVVDNDSITYTFIIQNTGNTAVSQTDTLTISDTFDPILTNITATLEDEPYTAFSYDENTGVFATNSGSITVPAATSAQDPDTGAFTTIPGTTTLTVTGTI